MTVVDKMNPSGTNERDRVSGTNLFSMFHIVYFVIQMELSCSLFCVAQYCTKLVPRRTKKEQERQGYTRERICVGSLL